MFRPEEDFQRLVQAIRNIEQELAGDELDEDMHRFPIETESPDQLLSMLKERFPTTQMVLNAQQDALLVWTSEEERPRVEATGQTTYRDPTDQTRCPVAGLSSRRT